MTYLAIMKVSGSNRIEKYAEFATQAEANAHITSFTGSYPNAYVVLHPSGPVGNLLCDTAGKTVSVSPPAPVKPTAISYEAFQNRFTNAEFNAATDFIYESDLVTGKPKRRALIQGLSRSMSKNLVDLLDTRTDSFLSALVNGGIITEVRKSEILIP